MLYFSLFFLLLFLFSGDVLGHTGELFRDEIGKVEALFTGGYLRLGLLGVCGVTAVMGASFSLFLNPETFQLPSDVALCLTRSALKPQER